MKVQIIKPHHAHPLGVQEIPDERAKYLIRTGVAKEIEHAKEKVEVKHTKEKVETKGPKSKNKK